MRVTAAPGLQVPKEGRPRAYITDAAIIDVPDSAYYRRLVACGDLVEPDSAKTAAKPSRKEAA